MTEQIQQEAASDSGNSGRGNRRPLGEQARGQVVHGGAFEAVRGAQRLEMRREAREVGHILRQVGAEVFGVQGRSH